MACKGSEVQVPFGPPNIKAVNMFQMLKNFIQGIFSSHKPKDYKQVIVVRTDLKMRRGKEIAQGAHASMLSLVTHKHDHRMKRWLKGPFTKIAVCIESEEELHALIQKANLEHYIVAPIVDSGKTEFKGLPTLTCAAFGPDTKERMDALTGHLKLR